MRAFKWVLMNGVFAALLWAAVAHGVDGAQNIVVVAVWLLLLMMPLMWTADMQKTLAERGRAVPAWLDGTFDVAFVAMLLWHGWMFTGVAYLLHAWLSHGAWNVALRKPANNAGERICEPSAGSKYAPADGSTSGGQHESR